MNSKSRTILIVDDEVAFLDMLSDVFHHYDCTVIKATNIRSALQILECTKVDTIILDIRMPGGNGTELLENIRTISTISVPNFIIVSGYPDVNKINVSDIRIQRVFHKPFIMQDLVTAALLNVA